MKKKLFAMMISLAMAMSFTVPAFAEEFTYVSDGTGEYSADTLVTYTEQSHYCVNIPRTLDASMVTMENPYYLTATQMNLSDGLRVEVYTTDTAFPMESDKGESINAYILNVVSDLPTDNIYNVCGYFTDGQTTSSQGFYIDIPSDIKTGTYTGTITFNISLTL